LGLDGSLKPVPGVLPALMAGKALGSHRYVVPLANQSEAEAVEGVEVLAFSHLTEVASFHGSKIEPAPVPHELEAGTAATVSQPCFSDVFGQHEIVDALAIAAAGGHHLLMVGPPGAGKTMLAERLPTILPPLTTDQMIETAAVESLSGLGGALSQLPPFRAPHHSSSTAAMIGGGLGVPRPGLISLAHNGVLFLDEAPEFQVPALESLRQPLESGEVFISRAAGVARFPARFQLVMAANPCPCGFAWEASGKCKCAEPAKSRYLAKLSGPLLDRVDMSLRVQRVPKALESSRNPTSVELRQVVARARSAAAERLAGTPWTTNAQLPGTYLRKHLKPARAVTAGLDKALERGSLSMRGYDRCLRLSLTVADIAGDSTVTAEHMAKAVWLRGGEL
jgi:magnesium chelatase family protein